MKYHNSVALNFFIDMSKICVVLVQQVIEGENIVLVQQVIEGENITISCSADRHLPNILSNMYYHTRKCPFFLVIILLYNVGSSLDPQKLF